VTKILMQAAIIGCAIAGILLWLSGYNTAGIGLVIAGYVVFIAMRLTRRVRKSKNVQEPQDTAEEEMRLAADSWEALRDKALEALNRKLRGQKLVLASFFNPAYANFAYLEKVYKDLSEGAPELTLKMDMEILKLHRGARETSDLLSELSSRVKSEEDLRAEIESLRAKAQA